ncbi:MAG: class I SAM-dependent rRNA methyltransferase [Prevotella sp.]|nr:class I SAM-dependent rRNA methyltransferase [Staphylococcus sp.]MCM1350580.1 class I SAM-dependent rRNA methyltransferase [Prevotella sp.]
MGIQSVILKKAEEQRILEGHPWIFSNEIHKFEGTIASGELCDVYSYDRTYIGRGFLNTASKIMVRMLSFEPIMIDETFFVDRISSAYTYRQNLGFFNNCRVVFGEADLLPGLIVDKYGDYLSIQVLSLGMEKRKDMIVQALITIFHPKGIMERSDTPIRLKEGLEPIKQKLYPADFNPHVIIEENGVLLQVDLENGQKTGYFLDQKTNRKALKQYVNGKRVLDCFSHTGGFALHAAHYGASSVTALDISQKACQDILENARLNQIELEVICTDVFDYLRQEEHKGKFDVIVLDPPAFTKSKDTVERAYRGYKEINMSALKLLEKNGILMTFSCSQHMSPALFLQMLKEAAVDAKKMVQMVDFKIQSPDHPTRLGSDESLYLKCVVLRVL